jgi:CRP/FNR family transcriptional regulator
MITKKMLYFYWPIYSFRFILTELFFTEMDRYLTKKDCNNCYARPGCFVQRIKQNDEFFNLKKSHITYRKGETIVKEGTRVTEILYVTEGLLKVYIEGPERNIIIKVLTSHDFIGLTSLFGDDTFYFSATALKETRVCSIDRQAIKSLLTQCCEFSRELSSWYCENYNIMLTKCLNLGLRQLHGKLANTLLYLSREKFMAADIFSYITRKDLAELSGIATESVVRILSEFNNENIIELKGKRVEIKDMERLKIISQKG